MSVAVGRGAYSRPRGGRLPIGGAVLITLVLLAVAGFLLGRALAPAAPSRDPTLDVRGIPAGIEHSPAGALAAADNYVSVSYDSVERDPAREARLIGTVYAPAIRSSALAGAASVRARSPAAMRLWAHGGRNVSLIGARRLDYYRGDDAQVTTWNADVFWGPGRPPKQAWVLTQTSLRWNGARWLVRQTTTLPTAGPVPAVTPQAGSANDTPAAFATGLDGFSAPAYGAAR